METYSMSTRTHSECYESIRNSEHRNSVFHNALYSLDYQGTDVSVPCNSTKKQQQNIFISADKVVNITLRSSGFHAVLFQGYPPLSALGLAHL